MRVFVCTELRKKYKAKTGKTRKKVGKREKSKKKRETFAEIFNEKLQME